MCAPSPPPPKDCCVVDLCKAHIYLVCACYPILEALGLLLSNLFSLGGGINEKLLYWLGIIIILVLESLMAEV